MRLPVSGATLWRILKKKIHLFPLERKLRGLPDERKGKAQASFPGTKAQLEKVPRLRPEHRVSPLSLASLAATMSSLSAFTDTTVYELVTVAGCYVLSQLCIPERNSMGVPCLVLLTECGFLWHEAPLCSDV